MKLVSERTDVLAEAAPTKTSTRPLVRTHWIQNPSWDVVMGLAWVPFAIAATMWSNSPGRIEWLVAATLAFSISHQPLTMPLVYADGQVFGSRRLIYTVTPFVVIAAVAVGLRLDPIVIAVVAGVWNAAHTLQQRYGIARIYGRKVGQANGNVEHWLLWALLVLALVWAAADPATPDRVASVGLGGRNQKGLDVLTDAAPIARVLLPVVIAATAWLVVRWFRDERASDQVNPAKWFYLGSTAGLIAVTIVSPVAGFVGYVGSHAAEYFLVVHRHLGDRYPDAATDGGAPIGRLVRLRPGPTGAVALYAVLVVALMIGVRSVGGYTTYSFVFLTLGALHLFYDGLIWKLRRPDVARGFGITEPAGG